MWQTYYNVSTLAEALELRQEHRDHARIIAGGTDLLLELERGQRPDVHALIDITRVPGLDEITQHGERIRLGALVNHNHVMGSSLIVERGLPLAQACREVGAPQIRNRATVAGNLITASPANDTITPLVALGAEVTLASMDGERTVALKDFYPGIRQTVMQPNEILTAISFPVLAANERGIFLKLGLRRAQAISVVNVAVVLTMDGDMVTQARITLGSVAPTIIRTPVAEQALQGRTLSPEVIAEVSRLAASTPSPIDDVRSSATYRSEMVRVLVARALRMLAANTQTEDWNPQPAMLWGQHQAQVVDELSEQTVHTSESVIETTINGQAVRIGTGQDKTLLRWLREDAGLPGTKEGCAEGECGACTVFVDDVAVMACMIPAPRAHGADIVTVEGLSTNGKLHSIQSSFINTGAVQCGYCTPGFLMSGVKLLEEFQEPTQEQIQQSISGNLCRCTGYYKIIQAFYEASQTEMMEESS